MSVNIDIREEGLRPTLKTSRMSVNLSDTGMIVRMYTECLLVLSWSSGGTALGAGIMIITMMIILLLLLIIII